MRPQCCLGKNPYVQGVGGSSRLGQIPNFYWNFVLGAPLIKGFKEQIMSLYSQSQQLLLVDIIQELLLNSIFPDPITNHLFPIKGGFPVCLSWEKAFVTLLPNWGKNTHIPIFTSNFLILTLTTTRPGQLKLRFSPVFNSARGSLT